MLVEVDIVTFHSVSHIEVVRQVGVLAGNRRDALHCRQDAELLAVSTNSEVLLLHVACVNVEDTPRNLEVAEAQDLCLTQNIGRNLLDGVVGLQFVFVVDDVLHAFDEPLVYLRQFFDAVNRITLFKCLCKGEDAEICRIGKFFIKVLELHMVVSYETMHALAYHTQALLKHFLETATDAHDFADGLHAGADLAAHTRKLREVPARNLTNQVVERRSYVGTVRRSHFADLVEGVAEGNLCSHKSKRITCCLTCEG